MKPLLSMRFESYIPPWQLFSLIARGQIQLGRFRLVDIQAACGSLAMSPSPASCMSAVGSGITSLPRFLLCLRYGEHGFLHVSQTPMCVLYLRIISMSALASMMPARSWRAIMHAGLSTSRFEASYPESVATVHLISTRFVISWFYEAGC